MNLHLRDIDPTMREYVAIGDGVMDFKAIVDSAKAVGFDGFFTLEQDSPGRDLKEVCRAYVGMMGSLLA